MMGERSKSEALFYYFKLEDRVPENHLLRLIDRYVDLGFVRARLRSYYSDRGRPSVDPEVLLCILLIGYLDGITSERRLVEEVGIRQRPLTPSCGGPSPYRGENSGSDRHINIKESLTQTSELENSLGYMRTQ